jgi:uncharacterized protein YecT (DUF1311 family)
MTVAIAWALLAATVGVFANSVGPAHSETTGPPASLLGTWDVMNVLVDGADQPHWQYRPDDPEIMGRELLVKPDRVQFNFGREANCVDPGWRSRKATWGYLMEMGFPRAGDTPTTPADYGLKVSRKTTVNVYSFCTPPASKLRPGAVWFWAFDDVWIVQQSPDRLVMHLGSQVMLILARRPADARPRASFPCQKASTPAEKTICGSFTLAALDRSVAMAWRRLTENGRADSELLEQQRAWLQTRDACVTDEVCLEREMKDRITMLPR